MKIIPGLFLCVAFSVNSFASSLHFEDTKIADNNQDKIFINEKRLNSSTDKSRDEFMEFVITIGVAYPGGYDEIRRFTVKVEGNNPKIETILKEFKIAERKFLTGTEKEGELRYQSSYYLESANKHEKLDPSKTASDYDLKSGSVLRVFTECR